MSIADIIAIVMAASSLVTALSVLYGKFIRPIKKVVQQVEDNSESIKAIEGKSQGLKPTERSTTTLMPRCAQ